MKTKAEISSLRPLKPATAARYLGIDVRARRFAFVAVENSVVLDCGTRMCRKSLYDNCLGQRFNSLLTTYRPAALIVRTANGIHATPTRARVAAAIRRRARCYGVELISIQTATIQRHFSGHSARTKHQVATTVASLFPELAWMLPGVRKPWETEHYRMSIFDAAAGLAAYLEL